MSVNKFDTRQSVQRSFLEMIARKANFDTDSYNELDNLLTAINAQLRPPFQLTANFPNNKIVNVGANFVTNPETDIRRTTSPINKQFPNFTGGTVTIPAVSGGTIAVSPTITPNPTLTISANGFIKMLIECDSLGNLSVSLGSEGASELLAGAPAINSKYFQIGYVVIRSISGTIQDISNTSLVQLTGGGGGGGGTGDTLEILERMKERFSESLWQFLSPITFATDENTLTGSGSTGSFSQLESAYTLNAGQNFRSVNLLESNEVGDGGLNQLELLSFWKTGNEDTAATYEVSRDGGTSWQSVTMTQIGTDTFRGAKTFTPETTFTSQVDYTTRAFTPTPITVIYAQKIQLANPGRIRQVTVPLNVLSVSAGSQVTVSVVASDTLGEASLNSTPIATTTVSATATGDQIVTLPVDLYSDASTFYFILLTPNATQISSSAIRFKRDAQAPAASPVAKNWNGTVWTALTSPGLMLHQLTGLTFDLRVRVTAAGNSKILKGLGVLYGAQVLTIDNINALDGNVTTRVLLSSPNGFVWELTALNDGSLKTTRIS